MSVDSLEWSRFVEASPQGTIFCSEWWLEAVSENCEYRIVLERRGREIAAAWPIVLGTRRRGSAVIQMPKLTPWLGILFAPEAAGVARQLYNQGQLTERLLMQLPNHRFVHASMHPTYEYWAPLFWAGYTETTRYSFVLDVTRELEELWAGLQSNIRGDIRKAVGKGVHVVTTDDLELFIDTQRKTFARQGLALPYSRALIERIDAECASRQARQIFLATDTKGRTHAAAYIVCDKKAAYYLMGGGDPVLRSSGATSLLLWECIKATRTRVTEFDFEGSMIQPVARFFRAFGGVPRPYHVVSRRRGLRPALRQAFEALRSGIIGSGE
jgi:hypothetical protein